MSEEYTIQKDEEEMRAERKRRIDGMIGRAIKAHRLEAHISSGMDMVMSAIYMLRGMMAEDDEVVLNEDVVDASKRMLEAARDLTDALMTDKRRKKEEREKEKEKEKEKEGEDDAEGQTDDVL